MRTLSRSTVAMFAWLAAAASAMAQQPDKVTYDDHVKPIFRDACLKCHNADRARGGLDLSSYGAALAGGSGGASLAAGDPESSRLYLLITHAEEPTMPPRSEPLPKAHLDTVKRWIAGGLLENAGSKPKVAKKNNALAMGATTELGKPDGPPPMPEHLLLEPSVVAARPGAVGDLAASPWAPVLAATGQSQVLLYSTETLELAGTLPFPLGNPESVQFTSNGRFLIAGGGRGGQSGTTVVWDVTSGEQILQVGEEYDSVLSADLSADLQRVALGGPDRLIKIYLTEDGSLEHSIKKHTDWVTAIRFSPDGVLLATGGRGGDLIVWETFTGREFYILGGHKGAITELSWRPDSNILASASEDGTIRLWEMFGGKQVKSWRAANAVTSVQFTRDGRLVSTGRDRKVKVWNQDGKALKDLGPLSDVGLAAAYDEVTDTVFATDWMGTTRGWKVSDGAARGDLDTNPPQLATRLAQAQEATTAADAHWQQLDQVRQQREQVVNERRQAQSAMNSALTAAQQALTTATTERDARTTEHQNAQTALSDAENALTARNAELAAANEKVQVAQTQQTGLNQEQQALQAALPTRQQAVTLLDQSHTELKKLADTSADQALSALLEQSSSAVTAARQLAATAEGRLQALVGELEAAAQQVQATTSARDQAANTIAPAQQLIAQRQSEMETATANVATAEETVGAKQQATDAAQQQLTAAAEATTKAEQALNEAATTATTAHDALAAVQRQVAYWQAAQINVDLHAARTEAEAKALARDERTAERDARTAERTAAATALSAAKALLAKAPEEIAAAESARATRVAERDAAIASRDSAAATLKEKQTFLASFKESIAATRTRVDAESANETLKQAAVKLTETVALFQADVEAAQAQLAGVESQLQQAEAAITTADEQLAAARAAVAPREAEVAKCEQALNDCTAREQAADETLAAAAAELTAHEQRVAELNAKYEAQYALSRSGS